MWFFQHFRFRTSGYKTLSLQWSEINGLFYLYTPLTFSVLLHQFYSILFYFIFSLIIPVICFRFFALYFSIFFFFFSLSQSIDVSPVIWNRNEKYEIELSNSLYSEFKFIVPFNLRSRFNKSCKRVKQARRPKSKCEVLKFDTSPLRCAIYPLKYRDYSLMEFSRIIVVIFQMKKIL